MIASVRDVIARDLGDGPPRIGTVAEGLHVSVRTLQRRLAEAGWTYLGLLDDVRRTVACERVVKTRASFKDVARDLGLAEQASFTRAFRRWTGLTPREFRRRARSSAVAPEGDNRQHDEDATARRHQEVAPGAQAPIQGQDETSGMRLT